MKCSRCGTEIPDEANFCWQCGMPQHADAEPQAGQDYETCQIRCSLVEDRQEFSNWFQSHDWYHGAMFKFWAQAVGPDGEYVVGESPTFRAEPVFPPPADDRRARDVYHTFLMRLVEQGWEPLGVKGDMWFSQQLRRPIPH